MVFWGVSFMVRTVIDELECVFSCRPVCVGCAAFGDVWLGLRGGLIEFFRFSGWRVIETSRLMSVARDNWLIMHRDVLRFWGF